MFVGVIKNIFGAVEENRKLISRVMDDVEARPRPFPASTSCTTRPPYS